MKCIRCGGLMTYEKVYYETEQAWGWNCISCGEFVDHVILENREYQRRAQEGSSKKREKVPADLTRTYLLSD